MRYVLIILFLYANMVQAQTLERFSRVRVDLTEKSLFPMARMGLDVTHGIYYPGKSIECDYSESEIEIIKKLGYKYEIVIEDVVAYYQDPDRPSELVFADERSSNCSDVVRPCGTEYDYEIPTNYTGGSMGGYKTFDEMMEDLEKMKILFPDLISHAIPIDSMMTNDSNYVYYLTISSPSSEEKPKVLYTALHHAREPNGMSQMLFFMWHLLENYGSDPMVDHILDNYTLFFVPCVNPDGYKLNELNEPDGGGLWRKNTYRLNDVVTGVDLNRNYGFEWGVDNDGSSPNPASNVYRGPGPFSEVETQAVRNLCESNEFLIALNYHTFGNLLIHPWGYNDQPTAEDSIFKGLGGAMIEENCFVLGTGTETVGYVVNGDSDDYMYGEVTTKNKIYSMTPEVGPSFWPNPSDIDFLNRSAMHMNLVTPLLAGNYAVVDFPNNPTVNIEESTMSYSITKQGLGDEPVAVEIWSESDGVELDPVSEEVLISPGQVITDDLNFTVVDKDIPSFTIYSLINYDGLEILDSTTVAVLDYKFEAIYTEDFSSSDNWEFDGFGLSSLDFISSDSSLADSPVGLYQSNINTSATMINPIDLSTANDATLSYMVKFSIENDYDYAQVLASTDKVNWQALCGLHTNGATRNQPFGEHLYDGNSDWVRESISLADFAGEETVYLRFTMTSDGFVEGDGIYVDDMVVSVDQEIVSSTLSSSEDNFEITPNPANDIVRLKSNSELARITVHNLTGQVVKEIVGISMKEVSLDLSLIESGTYIIQVMDTKGGIKSQKLVIVD